MIRYFITAEPKIVTLENGATGTTNERIVCKGSGYKIYRQNENSIENGLKPISYKFEKRAQELADFINEQFNDNFKVEAREV